MSTDEAQKAKLAELEVIIDGQLPYGSVAFNQHHTNEALRLPASIFNKLRDKNRILIIIPNADGQITLNIGQKPTKEKVFENARDDSRKRCQAFTNAYMTIYSQAQAGDWVTCTEVFQETTALLANLQEKKAPVSIPQSYRDLALNIADTSGGEITDTEIAEKVLVQLWKLLSTNGYLGTIKNLTQIGITPQNFRNASAGSDFD